MKDRVLIVEDQYVEANYLRSMLERAGYDVCGIARSVQKAKELVEHEKPKLVLLDIFLSGKQTGIDLAKWLGEFNIAYIYLSANSNEEILTAAKTTQPYGFLVKPFRETDLLITLEIARYRHEHSQESINKRESILQGQLASIVGESTTWEQKLLKIGSKLQPFISFDYLTAGFNTTDEISRQHQGFLRTGFDEYQVIGKRELETITGLNSDEVLALYGKTESETTATFYNGTDFDEICSHASQKKMLAKYFQLQSHLSLPLFVSDGRQFSFCLYSRRSDTYNVDHISLFNRIQKTLTDSIEIMSGTRKEKISDPTNASGVLSAVNNFDLSGFEGIIGRSHHLLNVFDHITQVAPTDTSVLILGESGTGKERIADCIHNLSQRKGKAFVKVNCAALPSTLIESELFGHEKGSFTGALERRNGKFEMANKGTIFLDEIGEMPVESQVKLLRVLQEKEVERIGSKAPLKVDVRIIAATNRNLEREVAEGRFRLDLYYRLNVFPILLPALRERKEDIPVLAYHFMNYYARKAGKKITGISEKILGRMHDYDWPGNIRELEHLIERSVLLAKGKMIEDISIPVADKRATTAIAIESRLKTIHENERDHIINVLKKCNGRIWGPGAAAEILDIPPSTLKSKMKKLGIKKEYID